MFLSKTFGFHDQEMKRRAPRDANHCCNRQKLLCASRLRVTGIILVLGMRQFLDDVDAYLLFEKEYSPCKMIYSAISQSKWF